MMLSNYANTVLRYPGGKSKLTAFIGNVLEQGHIKGTYVEPFSGGAGIGINLLFADVVNTIVINDLDSSVFTFWKRLLGDSDSLVRKISKQPLDYSNPDILCPEAKKEFWLGMKQLFNESRGRGSLDEAYSFFMLNRMNVSGIVGAGPIGGRTQDGRYTIASRLNKKTTIRKMRAIREFRERIIVQNLDAKMLIENILNTPSRFPIEETFVFVDPPYYQQGRNLYPSYMENNAHQTLASLLCGHTEMNWLVTYDNEEVIKESYMQEGVRGFCYSLQYTANTVRKEPELMFVADKVPVDSSASIIGLTPLS